MQKRKITAVICLAAMAMLALTGCTFTSTATTFNGMKDYDNQATTHISSTNLAIHLLLSEPLWGDATLDKTVDDMTAAAKDMGKNKVEIVQSSPKSLWYVFFPFSIILTPTITNVAANVK